MSIFSTANYLNGFFLNFTCRFNTILNTTYPKSLETCNILSKEQLRKKTSLIRF
jgi:hypothetical protein